MLDITNKIFIGQAKVSAESFYFGYFSLFQGPFITRMSLHSIKSFWKSSTSHRSFITMNWCCLFIFFMYLKSYQLLRKSTLFSFLIIQICSSILRLNESIQVKLNYKSTKNCVEIYLMKLNIFKNIR